MTDATATTPPTMLPSWLTTVLSIVALAFSIVGLTIVLARPTPVAMGVVDLGSVLKVKEDQFTALVSKAGATDADRAAALELVKAFAPKIEAAVASTREACQCILLIKAAVVSSSEKQLVDYTPMLRAKLGL